MPLRRSVSTGPWMVMVAACAGACADQAPVPEAVVTVRALDRAGAPVAGVDVYGHDPAWVLIDQQVTGADGLARLDVPAGGAITTHEVDPTVPAEGAVPHWFSVLSVAPGDLLHVPIERGARPVRTVPVIAPPLPAGAVSYVATAPCAESGSGADGMPATLWIDSRCPDHGPLVLTARGPGPWPSPVVAYVVVADVDLTATSIDVSGSWSAPADDYTVELSGLTAGGWVEIDRGALAGGYPVHWDDRSITALAETASFTAPRPPIGDGAVYRVSTGDGDFCASGRRQLTRSRAGDVDRFAVDLGELPSPLADVELGAGRIGWTGGNGAGGSGVGVWFEAAVGHGDLVGPSRTWYVVAPPGTTSIAYPADVGFTWPGGPAAGDRITALAISDIASTHWGSYADVRQRWADDPPRIEGDFVTRTASLQRQYAYLGCQTGR